MTAAAERFNAGTALITGAGAGIGEGFARHLASLGMEVVIADVHRARSESVAADIRREGGRAAAYVVDVTDADAVDALAEWTFATYGSLELLINNAGIETGGRTWELEPEAWRRVMGINVDGVFHGIRSFVPRMLDHGGPATVANVSSVGGVTTMPFQAAYITSKHAVVALTECLHQDIAGTGAPIQVSVIMPNWVRTRIFVDATDRDSFASPDSRAHFEGMLEANKEQGLEPVEAARHMTEALARGDFWIFSDDERCQELMRLRGEHLLDMTLPVRPSGPSPQKVASA